MPQLTNVPHHRDSAELDVRVKDGNVRVVAIAPKDRDLNPDNWWGVGDLYIGDHMFKPEMQDHLRMMVGRALISAIYQARDIGYRQAQRDIRDALGLPRR
jgi:hypothetical protein